MKHILLFLLLTASPMFADIISGTNWSGKTHPVVVPLAERQQMTHAAVSLATAGIVVVLVFGGGALLHAAKPKLGRRTA